MIAQFGLALGFSKLGLGITPHDGMTGELGDGLEDAEGLELGISKDEVELGVSEDVELEMAAGTGAGSLVQTPAVVVIVNGSTMKIDSLTVLVFVARIRRFAVVSLAVKMSEEVTQSAAPPAGTTALSTPSTRKLRAISVSWMVTAVIAYSLPMIRPDTVLLICIQDPISTLPYASLAAASQMESVELAVTTQFGLTVESTKLRSGITPQPGTTGALEEVGLGDADELELDMLVVIELGTSDEVELGRSDELELLMIMEEELDISADDELLISKEDVNELGASNEVELGDSDELELVISMEDELEMSDDEMELGSSMKSLKNPMERLKFPTMR